MDHDGRQGHHGTLPTPGGTGHPARSRERPERRGSRWLSRSPLQHERSCLPWVGRISLRVTYEDKFEKEEVPNGQEHDVTRHLDGGFTVRGFPTSATFRG